MYIIQLEDNNRNQDVFVAVLQRVNTIFYGRWIESSHYHDYRVVEVYVPFAYSIHNLLNISDINFFIYLDRCNRIRIVEDKDAS